MFVAALVGPQTGYPFERASPLVKGISRCLWQVVSSELSHGGDNALLNHAFFLEPLEFHQELSCQVLTGHDLDLYLDLT